MSEVFQALKQAMEEKKDTVLVTVIASKGSTPRKSGARMLVAKSGQLAGTVGGGAVEFQAITYAQTMLSKRQNDKQEYILAPNDIKDLGMICGGDVDILYQFISCQDQEVATICKETISCIARNEPCWIISSVNGKDSSGLSFYSKKTGMLGSSTLTESELSKTNYFIEKDGQQYYVEPIIYTGKVYVFGGGHVAQALVPVLKELSFYVVVADDRAEFLTEAFFPNADQRMVVDLTAVDKSLQIEPEDYAIIMTRGHTFDYELEKQLLKTQAHYIGVMGSKHKIATHIKKLQAENISMTEINRMTMPIGLKIKAETPAELAISIAGELILKRAEKIQ